MQTNTSRGIVTAADSNYFPGLMLLHRSVQECWPVPIACFDVGLTEEERQIARRASGLEILPLPNIRLIEQIKFVFEAAELPRKKGKRVWPLWICPILIAAAPFRCVFWIDSDVCILRRLDRLFDLLEDGPVFTPENNAPIVTPNSPELYELLPIKRPFDPLEPRVNSGVSGWDLVRDTMILEAYIHPIKQACHNSRIREAISWQDQGALIWAIQNTGMQDRVLRSTSWNLCVRHTSLVEHPQKWDEYFLAHVKAQVPEANLIHWNGTKLPWMP